MSVPQHRHAKGPDLEFLTCDGKKRVLMGNFPSTLRKGKHGEGGDGSFTSTALVLSVVHVGPLNGRSGNRLDQSNTPGRVERMSGTFQQ